MVGQDGWEEGRDEKKGRMMEVLFVGAVTDVSERSNAVLVEQRCPCRLVCRCADVYTEVSALCADHAVMQDV